MSMLGRMRRVVPLTLDRLRQEPEALDAFLHPDAFERRQGKATLSCLDLAQDWHVLHWLLTGSLDDPEGALGEAIMGGEEIGEDLGYGPPRLHRPTAVRRVHEALSNLDPAVIEERLRQVHASGAYGAPSSTAGVEDLKARFATLCSFFQRAADAGHAVLVWLE